MKQLISVTHAAALLRVTPSRVRFLIYRQRLKARPLPFGRGWLVSRKAVIEYRRTRQVGRPRKPQRRSR